MPNWRATAATAGGYIGNGQERGTTVPAESKRDIHIGTSNTVTEELQSLGLLEILDHDPRPSIVVDIEFTRITGAHKLQVVFCNAACKSWPLLDEVFPTDEALLPSRPESISYSSFVAWSISAHEAQCSIDSSSISASFRGLRWGYYTLKQRWRVISASVCEQRVDNQLPKTLFIPTTFDEEDFTNDESSRDLIAAPAAAQQSSTPNGTLIDTPVDLFKPWRSAPNCLSHVEFIRSVDWAPKYMGASDTWQPQHHQMLNMILRDPNPALLFWGKDLVVMYNEPMIPILGSRHPQVMGQPCEKIFGEVWASQLEPILIGIQENGQSFKQENIPLSVNKHGLLEESFFSYTFLPIIGADGIVAGIYQSLSEVTDSRLAQRRSSTLLQINVNTAEATEISELWPGVLRAFETNPLDVPVVLIYSAMESTRNDAASSRNPESPEVQEYILVGSVGVPQDQLNVIDHLELRRGANGLATLLHEASKSIEPLYSQIANDKLLQHMFGGLKERGFGEPCTAVATASIRPTGKQNVSGFLIIGVSPRRPYDQEYQNFVRLLQKQLSSSAASVILLAEERRRGCAITEEAATGQAEFAAQAPAWTKEAELRERHLSQFAQHDRGRRADNLNLLRQRLDAICGLIQKFGLSKSVVLLPLRLRRP